MARPFSRVMPGSPRIKDPYPQGRDALRELIDTCLPSARTLYAFVNNRFEGNAVITIDEVTKAEKPTS